MSTFKISTLSLFRGEQFNSKYEYVIGIEDTKTSSVVEYTVEDFFELTNEVSKFANSIKQNEKHKLLYHIQELNKKNRGCSKEVRVIRVS